MGGLGSGMNGVDCIAQVLECQRQERACKLSAAPALTSCAWAPQLALRARHEDAAEVEGGSLELERG